ncbi:MAG: OmpA family protein [Prevotella sp.]|nr:OmpA family protein [Prevotella sp.]
MKKLMIAVLAAIVLCPAEVSAQGFLRKLGEKAAEAGKRKLEQKVEEKVEREVGKKADEILDGKTTSDSRDNGNYEAGEAVDTYQNDTKNVKNDFVRGSVVMFEDNFANEQVGEFPSKWDLVRGNAEVASINGVKCIEMDQRDSWIAPLVKGGIKNYLGDVFTIEYDMLYDDRPKDGCSNIELDIMNEESTRDNELFTITYGFCNDKQSYHCDYCLTSEPSFTNKEGSASSAETTTNNDGRWHHFALSFNKRAIKFYVDGRRVINVPNAKPGAGWVTWFSSGGPRPTYIKNVVIAKGAVELYERNATDMSAVEKAIAETGKFVTNNILFETGKATLKPESMDEIQKVADFMKKNPSVRFEVQGHTDNQGSDAVNDPLSQQRAESVVKALEGLGVDGFNLRAVGKGSHEPVADNKTDAGRAKNRRVVFVKK